MRDATASDAGALAEIYGHFVLNTVVTFDVGAVTAETMELKRTTVQSAGMPFVVAADDNDRAVGYAAMCSWRPKAAYRHTVESSIYLSPAATGQGLGRVLMEALIERGREAGIRELIAVISDEGADASVHLHHKLGFESVGHLTRVGFKFDRWVGTYILQKSLGA
ncbi:phosphinothricin acetyltransferase [Rhodoglobus vestalii]|uniref:Phosphinothricin acetyltransferase n=1 Tax=Rhodoglobus vestalii TaxID=193384 RepID=A0A8H2K7G2_9MICO|nr:GNAT family N-acetyltransferase [Rhodoglobus vestalii]TQO19076.1 phosphinothricin acetyltransferase [Rhodoglobus vestalii]